MRVVVLISLGVFIAACSSSQPSTPPAPVAADAGDASTPPVEDRDRGARAFLGEDAAARAAAFETALRRTARVSHDGMTRLGTSFDAELARARARFVAARTPEDVYYALLSLKNALHDAHATYWHDPSLKLREIPSELVPAGRPVSVPINLRVEYDGDRAQYILEAKDIPPGSVLEAVDDVPASELPATLREWFPFSAPDGLHEYVARWIAYRDPGELPAPAVGATTRLRFRAGDASREATLTWASAGGGGGGPPPEACCDVFASAEVDSDYGAMTAVASGVGHCIYDAPGATVVRYCSLYYESRAALVADQNALLSHLASHPPAHLLFDVRENGGGDFDPAFFGHFAKGEYRIPTKALYFAPAFREDPAKLDRVPLYLSPMKNATALVRTEMIDNPSAEFSREFPFFCRTATCAVDEAKYQPQAAPATYPVAVLTGPFCMSSCDDFVSILRDNGMAKVAGLPSAGADSPFRFPVALDFANGTGVDLEVTVGISHRADSAGTILEAHPPAVDVVVRPNASNRSGYLKAVVAALGW